MRKKQENINPPNHNRRLATAAKTVAGLGFSALTLIACASGNKNTVVSAQETIPAQSVPSSNTPATEALSPVATNKNELAKTAESVFESKFKPLNEFLTTYENAPHSQFVWGTNKKGTEATVDKDYLAFLSADGQVSSPGKRLYTLGAAQDEVKGVNYNTVTLVTQDDTSSKTWTITENNTQSSGANIVLSTKECLVANGCGSKDATINETTLKSSEEVEKAFQQIIGPISSMTKQIPSSVLASEHVASLNP